MRALVKDGALCSTGAASSALKWERDSAGAFAGARYVARYFMMKLERAGDEVDAPPVFVAVARQLRISAQIIFFQRREGVRSGKGARA